MKKKLIKVIKKELIEIKEKYQDKKEEQKLLKNDDEAKIELEELIKSEEEIVITISNEGFIRENSTKNLLIETLLKM